MADHQRCYTWWPLSSKNIYIVSSNGDRRGWIDNTYILILCVNNIGCINGEVCVSLYKLIMDDFGCSGDPHFVPVGLLKILKFVSWV